MLLLPPLLLFDGDGDDNEEWDVAAFPALGVFVESAAEAVPALFIVSDLDRIVADAHASEQVQQPRVLGLPHLLVEALFGLGE